MKCAFDDKLLPCITYTVISEHNCSSSPNFFYDIFHIKP